jgi:hypothetical protein
VIKIFAMFPQEQIEKQREKLIDLIKTGRLPISPGNITFITAPKSSSSKEAIKDKSRGADLTIVGFSPHKIKENMDEIIDYGDMGNNLFVNTYKKKKID